MNDADSPPLLTELLRATHRFGRMLPMAADGLRYRLRRSAVLNVAITSTGGAPCAAVTRSDSENYAASDCFYGILRIDLYQCGWRFT